MARKAKGAENENSRIFAFTADPDGVGCPCPAAMTGAAGQCPRARVLHRQGQEKEEEKDNWNTGYSWPLADDQSKLPQKLRNVD